MPDRKNELPAIVMLAESYPTLVERFTPLVREVRLQRGAVRIIGIFVCFEAGARRIEDGGLFDETHFVPTPDSAALLLGSLEHQALIGFINFNTTFRDAQLYRAAQATAGPKAYVWRNRLNLRKFLATGCDDEAAVRPLMDQALRVNNDIGFKTSLLAFFVSMALAPGRLFGSQSRGDRKQRILFIKLDVLGDMIVTIPYIASLRQAYPDADLTVLASSRGAGILKEQSPLYPGGLCDRVLTWDAPWHFKFPKILGLRELVELVRWLPTFWRPRYDIVIQPVHFGTGIVFALLTFGRRVVACIDARLPLADRIRHLVSDAAEVPLDSILHMEDWAGLALGRLGVARDPAIPGLLVDPLACSRVRLFLEQRGLADAGKLILLNVGAGHPLRVWGTSKFAELAGELSRRFGAAIVLTGSKDDRALGCEIEGLAGVPVCNAAGEFSLNELVALTSMADLMVTVDTGIMHLAAALDTPLVAIFGAGLVDSCRPLSNNHVIVKEELGCSGCADRCFVEGYPPCLERVTVRKVLAAVERQLTKNLASKRGSE